MTGGGIYQIRNLENGKRYIGSAMSFRHRRRRHFGDLCRGDHHNRYLQNAWNLYGEKAFAFEVLEYVIDPEQLIEREQYYLDTLKPEYNICSIAESPLGTKRTEETRRKMSEAQKGRKHTKETRRRISEAQRGKALSEEHKQKLSRARQGKTWGTHTEETKQKIGEARRGQKRAPFSEEWRRRISEAIRGSKHGNAKLTESDVREIKRLLQEGSLSQREIGELFGVSRAVISNIGRGACWAHVTERGN